MIRLRSFMLILTLAGLIAVGVSAEEIHVAADTGNLDSVKVLLQQDPSRLGVTDEGGYTALHKAAYAGHTDVVRYLLDRGAKINATSNSGSTPLHGAAYYGHLPTVECLIEAEADVNRLNSGGYTPLHSAMAGGHANISQVLIKHGADPTLTTNDGNTVLLMAVQSSSVDLVELILSRGPDLEIADSYGRTALLLTARESGDAEITRVLIDAGANMNAHDRFGSTSLELAAWRGFSEIVDVLLNRGAEFPSDKGRLDRMLTHATETGLPRLFAEVIARGADISARNPNDGSYLHSAATGGNAEIVMGLLKQGLPVNERDKYGWTALHYATSRGRIGAVRILLENGAEINAATMAGYTPLSIAHDRERVNIAELLVQHGADQTLDKFVVLEGPYLGQTPPGNTVTWFAPDIVSSPRFEHSNVTFSYDGTEAFWGSSFHLDDSGYTWSRMMTSRIKNGRWTKPAMASFSSVRSGDDAPFYNTDGSQLYFVSMRPTVANGEGSGHHLWVVDRTDDGWSQPRLAPAELNEISGRSYRSMAASGNVYIAGPGDDFRQSTDIYISRLSEGQYMSPVSVGGQVNSVFHEHACIAPDESYMIIQRRDHPDGLGDSDLFVSFRDNDGHWTTPMILPEPISTSGREWYPAITPDGKYLFFNSHRAGEADLYWVSTDAILAHRDKALQRNHATRPRTEDISLRRSSQQFEPTRTNAIGVGDLDNDGDLDLACANMHDNDSRVWLNDGTGTFAVTDQLLTRQGHGIALDDVDSDGDLDILMTCADEDHFSRLYLNDGAARFVDSYTNFDDSLSSGNKIELHDVDCDGDLDAVIIYYQEDDRVYINDGRGGFSRTTMSIPENATWRDLNGDGAVDILAREVGVGFATYLNDGTGSFARQWDKQDSTIVRGNIELVDLDGDGDLDAVIGIGGDQTVRATEVWHNDGTGRFTVSDLQLPITQWARFASGDFNNDGHLDIFVTNFGLPDYIWINDGNGGLYDTGLRLGGYGTTINPALGDIDGDGDLDILVPDFAGGANVIWFNEMKQAPILH